jgi:hypothetical protein
MSKRESEGDSGRVLAVAAAVWGTVIGVAALEGAFALFPDSSVALFAALASLYAVATCLLDRELRAHALRADPLRAAALALALALALAAALALRSAPLATFFAPLAAWANAAAAGVWLWRASPCHRARSAPAKSPGANRAAT